MKIALSADNGKLFGFSSERATSLRQSMYCSPTLLFLSLCVSLSICVCLSVSVSLSFCLCICLSVCLSLYLPLSLFLSLSPPISLLSLSLSLPLSSPSLSLSPPSASHTLPLSLPPSLLPHSLSRFLFVSFFGLLVCSSPLIVRALSKHSEHVGWHRAMGGRVWAC